MYLPVFRQSPYSGICHCKVFFVCGWLYLQEIEIDGCFEFRERKETELHYSSVYQTVLWCHFIRATDWNKLGNFEFPDTNPVECGTVSTGKRQFSVGKYCSYLQERAFEV
jgi:hypothetical protein